MGGLGIHFGLKIASDYSQFQYEGDEYEIDADGFVHDHDSFTHFVLRSFHTLPEVRHCRRTKLEPIAEQLTGYSLFPSRPPTELFYLAMRRELCTGKLGVVAENRLTAK